MALLEKIKNAENFWNQDDYYPKAFDIIQSSGTGKSWLVSELGKHVLSVCFVLRKPGETGFPPGDPEIFSFLMEGDGHNRKDAHDRAAVLLGSVGETSQSVFMVVFPCPRFVDANRTSDGVV